MGMKLTKSFLGALLCSFFFPTHLSSLLFPIVYIRKDIWKYLWPGEGLVYY